jgi:hypothetical protein
VVYLACFTANVWIDAADQAIRAEHARVESLGIGGIPMRHLFAIASSTVSKVKWVPVAQIDEALWKGVTLFMLILVTVIVALLSR